MTTKKPTKTLKPIWPNAGVETDYRRELKKRVKKMSSAYQKWLTLMIASKANTEMLTDMLDGLINHWQSEFDNVAPILAEKFGSNVKRHTDAAMIRELKNAGFAFEFSMTENERAAYSKVVAWNVSLIKSIPNQYHDRVTNAVYSNLTTGHDLEKLKFDLMDIYGITERRAAFIARDQNNKANSVFENARRLDIGFTEAIWLHSSAGKEPRPGHVKAGKDRLRYDIRKGAFIDGEHIQPGQLINCRCNSITVIPGIYE